MAISQQLTFLIIATASIAVYLAFGMYGSSWFATGSAPLHCEYINPAEGYLVPGEYMIVLKSGHSFEAHCNAVNMDMTQYIDSFNRVRRLGGTKQVWYVAHDLDDDALECVRTDPRIDYIECNTRLWYHEE
jgi:hypothetical protein